MLAVPGALAATLGYYRAMFDPARADPDLAEVRQAAGRIVVPTLALCGAEDKRAEVMQDQARHFAGPYRFELVPGSSHFLQRERPQAVTELPNDRHKDSAGRTNSGPIGTESHSARWAGTSGPGIGR